MYDGNTNERRTIEENYSSAVGGSSLRVGVDHAIRTPGDVIAAAGMNRFRTGQALTRLMTEWHSGATPPPTEAPSVKELRQGGTAPSVLEAEHRRYVAQCTKWNLQEHMLRFQRLKTLPAIRAGLVFYVKDKGWEDAEHLVAAVLRRFLSPVCPACQGRKKRVAPGTGRLDKKDCGECRGTGAAKVPYGYQGQRLLEYIASCTGAAAADLREGAHKLHRGAKNVEDRSNQRARDDAVRMQRAGAEEKADLLADTEAVAEHFRKSMTASPRRRR